MAIFKFYKSKKSIVVPIAKYLNHLYSIFQVQPRFYKEETLQEGVPGITIIVYEDMPYPGCITGVTYGLSLVKHPDWENGRTELCITVESSCLDWALAIGGIANKLRGSFSFSYGKTITFGKPICKDSDMDAFFIFSPGILDVDEYLDIDIGTDYKINIAGLYPMYSDELKEYYRSGFEKFWHDACFYNYSVNRKRVTIP
jgi:hypothetical protein